MPHLEIPLFDGSKPRWWICRCERFFQLYNVPEVQRITMVAVYLNDAADSWYQGWIKARVVEARWNELAEELYVRFGEKNMSNVIEEFKMMKQTGTVTDYLDKFKELRALIWNAQPYLTKQYFISNFVSGLKGELQSMVKMMLPTIMRQATEKAKLQELTLEAIFGRGKPWLRM